MSAPGTVGARHRKRLLLGAVMFAAFLVCVRFVRYSVADYYCVNGESMEPTLLPGDCVLVGKGRFANRTPPRAAVVVLRIDPGRHVVKRVIARGGDTLAVSDGRVLVNGAPLPESYLDRAATRHGVEPPGGWHFGFVVPEHRRVGYRPDARNWGPLVVPESALFVLGDNRRHSGDSRSFGFVAPEEVVGIASRVLFSYDPRGRPPSVRARRTGRRL